MSYDIRIERLDGAGERAPIELDEWEALVEREADLRLNEEPVHHITNPRTGASLSVQAAPGMAIWNGHPDREIGLHYRKGIVYTRNPDDRTLSRMRELALTLQARVRGEEGEFYDD